VKKEKILGRFPPWYKAYHIEMQVNNVLGSLPANPDQLKYVKNIYTTIIPEADVLDVRPKELMDVDEATYKQIMEKAAGRCIFRRDKDSGIYFSTGQIVGWLEEAIRSAQLSRKIRNITLTFATDPRRIHAIRNDEVIKQPDREVVRPVKGFTGGQWVVTLAIHECIDECTLDFYLLTTNDAFDKHAEQVFEVGERIVGIGPARAHGYGEIEALDWKRIQ